MRQNKFVYLFMLALIHIYNSCKQEIFSYCRVTNTKVYHKINILWKYFGFFPFNPQKADHI